MVRLPYVLTLIVGVAIGALGTGWMRSPERTITLGSGQNLVRLNAKGEPIEICSLGWGSDARVHYDCSPWGEWLVGGR